MDYLQYQQHKIQNPQSNTQKETDSRGKSQSMYAAGLLEASFSSSFCSY
jgi:hypothetical protein